MKCLKRIPMGSNLPSLADMANGGKPISRSGLEVLAEMEYPGRVILVGMAEAPFVSYAITGRSSSSQARRLVLVENTVKVEPTNEVDLKKGNPGLLVYPAIKYQEGKIFVSNGKQTDAVFSEYDFRKGVDLIHNMAADNLVTTLSLGLSTFEYEPDFPNFTPRITGIVNSDGLAALSIIKKAGGGETSIKVYFDFKLPPGCIRFISTYTGENRDPLPSFEGEPISSTLAYSSAEEITNAIYDSLGPNEFRQKDFRVSVATMLLNPEGFTVSIKNRHGG